MNCNYKNAYNECLYYDVYTEKNFLAQKIYQNNK